MRKIRTHHKHPEGKVFSWMVLIMGFGIGLLLPILPTFIKSIIKTNSGVSLFYAGISIIMFISALASTIIFRKVERTTIAKYGFAISAAVSLLLIFVTTITELAIVRAITVWFNLFLLIALSLFVRDFAKSKDLGREEGVFYLFHNMGYLLGPLCGGFLAVYFGYELVFILSSIIMLLGLFYFYHKHIIQEHPAIINLPKKSTGKLITNIKEFFSNRERIKAYGITLIVMGWIGFKKLYIPLFVLMAGYVESMSGIILALGIVPAVLLEARVGQYADKHDIRLPITVGFSIMALSLFGVFFSPNALLSFGLIILGNIGMALVEPLQEYYLFKHLPKSKEEDLYGVYMTSDPVAYFMVPAFGALILLFLPFKFLFLVFGIVVSFAAVISWTTLKR